MTLCGHRIKEKTQVRHTDRPADVTCKVCYRMLLDPVDKR